MRERDAFREVERRLQDRRSRLLERLDMIARELSSSSPAPEAATGGCPTLAAIIATSRRELEQVDGALRRLRAGQYGACLRCRAPIAPRVLERAPYRLFCEACGGARASDRRSLDLEMLPVLLGPVVDEVDRAIVELERRRRRGWADDNVARGIARGVTAVLSDFRLQLAGVFAQEADEAPLRDALDHAPRFVRPARRLAREHPDLLARVDRLVAAARAAGTSPERWRAVRAALREVAGDLVDHQRAEQSLCTSAFLHDLGGG